MANKSIDQQYQCKHTAISCKIKFLMIKQTNDAKKDPVFNKVTG